MDAIDEHILEILAVDGRASFSSIGHAVGLSTNATAARIRRLEREGVIVGYRAVLADERADPTAGIEAFIDVRLAPTAESDDFLEWVQRQPPVIDAAHVTGPYDYLLRIRVRDMPALDALLRILKSEGSVAQTQTRIALR